MKKIENKHATIKNFNVTKFFSENVGKNLVLDKNI